MLLWIKALFTSEKPLPNAEDFVPYTDIFGLIFLTDLFTAFQEHINAETLTGTFREKIKANLFQGREWENAQKIMGNLEMGLSDDEVAIFLEQLAYRVYFPQMEMSGHKFTDKEKTALAGFAFFADNCDDEDYPFPTIEEQIVEMGQNSHPEFIEFVFTSNLKGLLVEHTKFLHKECTV